MKVYPSLTDRLKTQHQSIKIIVSGIATSRTQSRPQPDKWNIHDNIAHLARYQHVFFDRINTILVKEEPSFGRYRAEDDDEFEKWRSLNIETLTKQIDIDRKRIFDCVSKLADREVNRIGIHKKFGPLNIIQWTEFFLLHEAHHIFTIFQLAHDTEL